MREALRALPSVDRLLQGERGQSLCENFGRSSVTEALRVVLDEARAGILAGDGKIHDAQSCIIEAERRLRGVFAPTLRPIINATGVILHTNLGRAPLSVAASEAMRAVAHGYSTLEYDLAAGGRGSRHQHAASQLRALSGAEDALVVNNNAAALVLLLSALARGREVVISRGQLVEIGGGFRIPEIMRESGAVLREVGSTNRTRREDYARAIGPRTALLLRVHPSNFRQVGFTETTPLAELVSLARENELLVADDVGSGALLDTAAFGLPAEPTVGDGVAAGADVVLFSGDKLLGGPQAGILIGKGAVLAQLKRHPLARAMRADKLALAALCATLDAYLRERATVEIPIWWMMARAKDELREVAARWQKGVGGELSETLSTVGGGSLPGGKLPTVALVLAAQNPERTLRELRKARTPIIARIEENRVLLDPRTVLPDQEEELLAGVRTALANMV